MQIKNKIFLVIIPLILISLTIIGSVSALYTYTGLKQFGIRNQSLKASQLEQYINEQWNILQDNNIEINNTYLQVFEKDIILYAANLIRSNSELIFAINTETDEVHASTNPGAVTEGDIANLKSLVSSLQNANSDTPITKQWINEAFSIQEESRIGYFFTFEPLQWIVFITDSTRVFFASVRNIITITIAVIAITMLVSLIIIIFFTRAITSPIKNLISSMHNIIKTRKLSDRVPVVYNDEIGVLSHTFNVTIEELEDAYKQIRTFAFRSVLAKKQENKIRNIFQKYVPNSVINELFKDPSQMLVGDKKELAILFTDIRGFTTISESYTPDELVAQLNIYFEKTVGIIIKNNGIIDKYIGDAIMAFFGAPVSIKNSSLMAVQSALHMQLAIAAFNKDLKAQNKPEFITGMGINYGEVTVGNIGSEHKMDYTVIGDAVNLGSRLEGLTKQYKQNVIFSSSVCNRIRNIIPCRLIDTVQVKGKTHGEKIYTTIPYFTSKTIDAFALHNEGVELYLHQEFSQAIQKFKAVMKILKNDYLAEMYIERCNQYIQKPPPKRWNGVFIMRTK